MVNAVARVIVHLPNAVVGVRVTASLGDTKVIPGQMAEAEATKRVAAATVGRIVLVSIVV